VACSGKFDAADEGTPPPQLCREYATTWCNKFFTCSVKVGRTKEADKQAAVSKCYDIINERLPCADVQSVTDDYDTCITQINGMSCAKWDVPTAQAASIVPPASCDNAMSFD
jgi:hypothetical protein